MKFPSDQPLSRFNPDELHHRMVRLGEVAAEKRAAAMLLYESRHVVLARLMTQFEGSVASRERAAESTEAYHDHIKAMVDAQKQADIARVHYDAAKSWVEMSRSIESTRRAEMTLR